MDNFALFLAGQGLGIGFSAAMLPGPLQGYLMNTALKHGWRRALFVVVSPLIVDIPIVLAVLFALDALAAFVPQIVDGIRILGGVFVLFLAWGAWRDVRAGTLLWDAAEDAPTVADTSTPRQTLSKAMLLNALSPGPYLFWTTVNGPLLQQGLTRSVWHGITFLVAFYGTFLGLLVVMAMGIDRLRRVDPRLTRALLLVVAGLLTVFGGWLIYTGAIGIVSRAGVG